MDVLTNIVSTLTAIALAFGNSHTVPPQSTQAANESVSQSESANWAGYAATNDTYTGVGASWQVPAAAVSQIGADATWVGIGGVSSRDLIQAGTQAIVQDGAVTYEAWYELLPDYQQRVPLEVSAGDRVSVSIREISDGLWRISFTNTTTGKSYSTDVPYDSSLSSAEWIEERPVAVGGRFASYVPLDNFGSITFENAYAIDNGANVSIAAAGGTSIRMVTDTGGALASPSALSSNGFSVSREAEPEARAPQTYATPNVRTYRGHRGHLIILSVPTTDGEDDYVLNL